MAKTLTQAELNVLMKDPSSHVFRKGIVDALFLFEVVALIMLSIQTMLLMSNNVWFRWLPLLIFVICITILNLSRKEKALIVHPKGLYLYEVELDNRPEVQSLKNLFIPWDELTRLALRSRVVNNALSRSMRPFALSFLGPHEEVSGCQLMFATRKIRAAHVLQLSGILNEFDIGKREKIVAAISTCSGLKYNVLRNNKLKEYWCYEFMRPNTIDPSELIQDEDWLEV